MKNFKLITLTLASLFVLTACIEDVDENGNPILPTPTPIEVSADLLIEDIVIGEGVELQAGQTAMIHYKGTLEDGTQFDSSYDRGEPFEVTIGVGEVIEGWDQGVPGMKVGGKRMLTIPPHLGYGDADQGTIPPNSTLIFEVELIEIVE